MDESTSALTPSATGILRCLRLLAQEAATLRMNRTLSAIEDALDMVVLETGRDAVAQPHTRPGVTLH